MSYNPLENDSALEEKIRERAYHLWETNGKSIGNDLEYWERARELIGMENSYGAGQLEVLSEGDLRMVNGVRVEEASIQKNLGEFPDRSADQGERLQSPDKSIKQKSL